MNEDKQVIRDFWNYRSQTFDKSPGHYAASKEEEEAWKVLLRSKLGNAEKILDIGSGTGFLSLILADMGYGVVGIDLSEKMITRASAKAREKGLPIAFHQDDAENLGFENNSFDAIVNRAVLWTLPHPDIAVREWMRVLRPGGKLCFFPSRTPRRPESFDPETGSEPLDTPLREEKSMAHSWKRETGCKPSIQWRCKTRSHCRPPEICRIL